MKTWYGEETLTNRWHKWYAAKMKQIPILSKHFLFRMDVKTNYR
jgi:hypothetical protein